MNDKVLDMGAVRKTYQALRAKLSVGNMLVPGFRHYTGNGEPLGAGQFYNSDYASEQVFFTMALSQHPAILILAEDSQVSAESFNPENLVQEKVLKGIKALDLGSGKIPSYARCVSAMGSDVYTIDVKGRSDEKRKHIQKDLNDPDALEVILEKTKGDFNLVTAAQLISMGDEQVPYLNGYQEVYQKIAIPLLRDRGVFFGGFGGGPSEMVVKRT